MSIILTQFSKSMYCYSMRSEQLTIFVITVARKHGISPVPDIATSRTGGAPPFFLRLTVHLLFEFSYMYLFYIWRACYAPTSTACEAPPHIPGPGHRDIEHATVTVIYKRLVPGQNRVPRPRFFSILTSRPHFFFSVFFFTRMRRANFNCL